MTEETAIEVQVGSGCAPLKMVRIYKSGCWFRAQIHWDKFPPRYTKNYHGRAKLDLMIRKERELEASRARSGEQ